MNGKWRSLVVVLALSWSGAACDTILGPTLTDANWRVIDTEHFSFHVRPGSLADQNVARLAEVLDDQYDATLRALDIRYAGRVSLFLYASQADGDMQSERSGQAYPETQSVRATAGPPLDDNLFGLLSHEVNHVIQQNALGRPGTAFVGEGLPSAVISDRFHLRGKTFQHDWSASHDSEIPALSNLIDVGQWDRFNQQMTYAASASFLAYLLEVNGPAKLKQLHPVTSAHFQERFQQIYGRSLAEAEREWRAFCAARRR